MSAPTAPRQGVPRLVALPWVVQADASGVVRVAAHPPPDGEAAEPETPLRALEYVVVDVETTGGTAKRGHRVTEVAALRCAADGRVLEEFSSLVNPERAIPPFISSLTNISWEMVADAPLFGEIAPEVARMLRGRVFVAHNAAFDWRFLSWELERATGLAPDERVLCTVRLARKVVPEVGSRSLDALSYFFGLHNEARHRAYGDARVTAELLGRLMARLEEREVCTWEALEQLIGRRKPRKPRKRLAMPMAMDVREIPVQ
ncbi:MAG TPA: exonuclease domain-containing protein [Longimicrobiales bacterium]